jgi:hypothetical protein
MPKLPPFNAPVGEFADLIVQTMKGHESDPTVSILRAHLLIEQFLNDFIRHHVEHPEYLDHANLRFGQKLRLCQAMCSGILDDTNAFQENWSLISKLNTFRNDLAHQGFGEIRESKVKEFDAALRRATLLPEEQGVTDAALAAAREPGERVYTALDVMLAVLCTRVGTMLQVDIHFKPILNEASRQAGFPPLTKIQIPTQK